jgi:hypothetical protein
MGMTNGHQPISTEFNQLGPDGEQQLGINLGSSDKGRQMGINPCSYIQ